MQNKKLITGTIKRNPDGFGFLIPDKSDHPDVYIPRNSMEGVMTSDKVLAQVSKEKNENRYRGEVLKITERGFKKVVGEFHSGFIRDESKGWGADLKINPSDSLGAKNGQFVAAEIISYPNDPKGFLGRIVSIIGNIEDPLQDIKRVLLVNNIPHEFSTACLKEAEKFSESVEEKDFIGRKDLRTLNIITIDGVTAKDFDDAIYVENNSSGFKLFVAIADVSHYVQQGSAIDKDAWERGTSVYYPNFVSPMLPEVLSNGLCSLKPNVPRLTLVAEMQISFSGEIENSQFYEAIIQSKARVTYGEAQEIVDGKVVQKLESVAKDILRAADLAKILMARRFRDGSLDLEIPEIQLMIDSSGNPIDVVRSERLFSHRLIEELMLAANIAVAKFLASRNIPALYRVHESPHKDAIAILERYLHNFGSKIDFHKGKLQKRLTYALEEFSGKPEAQILNILTLRAMAQAKYSSQNLGHFGLGFDFYTHFTSPIRRYPDLIVHRLVKNQILPNSKYRLMSEDDLASAGVFLSGCEQRAVKSERQLISIKKARFMKKFIGQELEGMISSVTKFGVFVLIKMYEVDGLIKLADLAKDRYEFDEETLRLVSAKTGHFYSIGDPLTVIVTSVDIEAGQINFTLAKNLSDKKPVAMLNLSTGKKGTSAPSGKKKKNSLHHFLKKKRKSNRHKKKPRR